MNGLRSLSQPPDAAKRKNSLHNLLTAALVAAPVMLSTATAQVAHKVSARDAISTRSTAQADPRRSAATTNGDMNPVLDLLRNKRQGTVSLQAEAQYRVFDSLINAFSYFTGGQEPLVYDAPSNTLATIKRGSSSSSDKLYILTSRDLGVTWSAPKMVYDASEGSARYPSLLIINPTGSSSPSNLIYYFTAPVLSSDGTTFGRYITGLADDQGTALGTIMSEGVGSSTWATTSKSILTGDGKSVLVVGDLSENNLGLRRFSAEDGSLTSDIPAPWTSDHFSDPGSPTSRTAVTVAISRDMSSSSGPVYVGIFSRFPDAESDGFIAPYPAVSSSTDNGATWSDFDVIPRSVITAYGNSQGVVGDSVRFLYNQAQDFMATGTDKVSFVLDLFEINADKPAEDPVFSQIVEAYRENGTWGIRKIADATGQEFRVNAGDSAESSQLGNELQIARTADGTKLIAKWTDLVSYVTNADLDGDGNSGDTLTTTDVFVASRPVSGGSWGSAENVTNSLIRDLVTWVPSTLPNDLTKMPLLTLQRNLNGVDVPTPLDSLVTLQQFVGEPQLVTMVNVDASLASGVTETVVARSGMKLDALYPNPAGAQAAIGFTTMKPGRVTIDLFNVTGERVMALQNGTMEPGEHTISFSAAGLTPGAYYYRLQSNGETLTRAFTVVR